MTREDAIAIIENEKECVNRANKNDYCNRDCYNCELVKTDTEILTALDMAIASLKTDEAYQLEYENRDFVEIPKGMTNGEVIQILFPNISVYEHGSTYSVNNEYNFNATWWNSPYQKGGEE